MRLMVPIEHTPKFTLDVLVLAEHALTHDPRELAGQVLGRIGIEQFTAKQQHLVDEAKKWLKKAFEQ